MSKDTMTDETKSTESVGSEKIQPETPDVTAGTDVKAAANPDNSIADSSSLDLLHDIVTPDAASWFPLAPGWQILLALIALLILIGFLLALIRWQRNAYRREALAELKQLLDRDVPANDPERLAELSVLLKRTAITAFPRQQVASQTGPEWFAFLDHTGGTGFSTSLGSRLEQANYCSQRADWGAPQLQELADAIRLWIKRHG